MTTELCYDNLEGGSPQTSVVRAFQLINKLERGGTDSDL